MYNMSKKDEMISIASIVFKLCVLFLQCEFLHTRMNYQRGIILYKCLCFGSILIGQNKKEMLHAWKRHLPTLSKCACKMVGAIVFKVRRSAYIYH